MWPLPSAAGPLVVKPDLQHLLDELTCRLQQQGADVVERLERPGPSADDVVALLTGFVGSAPDELVSWFSWANGLRGGRSPSNRVDFRDALIAAWEPYSLQEAMEAVKGRGVYYPGDSDKPWLPLVTGGEGQQRSEIVAVFTGDGVVMMNGTWGEPPRPVAGSLADLVAAWIDMLDQGLRWEPDGKVWTSTGLPHEIVHDWIHRVII